MTAERRLRGGSGAAIEIVVDNGVAVIRKSATGQAALKLSRQVEWLKRHAASLPLTEVVAEHARAGFFAYDMPLVAARDFYDVIHDQSVPETLGVLRDVIEQVDAFHRRFRGADAPDAIIERFLEHKAAANARAIMDFARERLGEVYFLNGERFELADWRALTERRLASRPDTQSRDQRHPRRLDDREHHHRRTAAARVVSHRSKP